MGGEGETTIVVADPGAGLNWSMVVPPRHTYRVISMCCHYVMSAVAGSRRFILLADDGTHEYLAAVANSNMAANDAGEWSAYCGGESVSFTSGAMQMGLPPDGLYLPAGHRLRTLVNGMLAGDTLTDVRVRVQDISY